MLNIQSFHSTITPLDLSSDGYVSQLKIVAVPLESVMFSELKIDLLTDYIRDINGIPHTADTTKSIHTVTFGRTEYVSDS